jgi:polyisoprenoid-binding protein YceI
MHSRELYAACMRRPVLIVIGLVVLAVVVGAGVFGYLVFSNRAQPGAASLDDVTATPTDPASEASSPEGDWVLEEDGESFVGYRVTEQVAQLPVPNEAVGRTTVVDGRLEVDGTQVAVAEVTADLTRLTSDEARRDDAIRGRGLESDRFPEATFVLTSPIDLGEVAQGEDVQAEAAGDLTVHGVTRPVVLDIDARWDTDVLRVVGTTPFSLQEFEIEPPIVGRVVSIEDAATVEFEVSFRRG